MSLSYPNPGSTGGVGRRSLVVSRAASVGYASCFLAATVLSVRRGHKAEPLGIRSPFPIPLDPAVGIGTGLAAPGRSSFVCGESGDGRSAGRRSDDAPRPVALLGALFLAGAAAEPVNHRLLAGRLRPDEGIVATLNFLLPVVIVSSALMSLAAKNAEPTAPVEPVEGV